MKMIILSLVSLIAFPVFADDSAHMPKSFTYQDSKAVFGDFSNATFAVEYNMITSKATVEALINLTTSEEGYLVFDSDQTPSDVALDGVATTSKEISTPDQATKVRVLGTIASPGKHVLTMSLPLTQLVKFLDKKEGVKSAYWMTDLSDRGYLERYFPSNFEFDRIQFKLELRFIGGKNEQRIYTNGVVQKRDTANIGDQRFTILFPEYFTPSCMFFHTAPVGSFKEHEFTFSSIDGREIPALIYTAKDSMDNLERLSGKALEILKGLEADFGAFLHPSITIYIAGSGGMEYSGATMTSTSAMSHELFHSYFARGVMPANGNAGWIDEALASWRDNGFPAREKLNGSSMMAAHQYYTRSTDIRAYSFGANFMALLNHKFQSQGGLKTFLKHMAATHRFQPLFTEDFYREMSSFYHTSVEDDFKQYVYGDREVSSHVDGNARMPKIMERHHFHHQYTMPELEALL